MSDLLEDIVSMIIGVVTVGVMYFVGMLGLLIFLLVCAGSVFVFLWAVWNWIVLPTLPYVMGLI